MFCPFSDDASNGDWSEPGHVHSTSVGSGFHQLHDRTIQRHCQVEDGLLFILFARGHCHVHGKRDYVKTFLADMCLSFVLTPNRQTKREKKKP